MRVSWQPVVTRSDEVEYTLSGWKDGAGEPTTLYRCVIIITCPRQVTAHFSQRTVDQL